MSDNINDEMMQVSLTASMESNPKKFIAWVISVARNRDFYAAQYYEQLKTNTQLLQDMAQLQRENQILRATARTSTARITLPFEEIKGEGF